MIMSIAILIVSVGLFLYWFRYTCLLILSAKTTRDYAGEIAMANQLRFAEVEGRLVAARNCSTEELDRLQVSLQRDYELITYLVNHAAECKVGDRSLEDTMLKIDYRVMRAWYSVARSFSSSRAKFALEEMCHIVGYFANSMGERAASGAQI